MTMARYAVYDKATGILVKVGRYDHPDDLANMAGEGQAALDDAPEYVEADDLWTWRDGEYFRAESPEKTDSELAAEREHAVNSARRQAYGSAGDQLDMIYHHGIDAWREHVAGVKAQFPKLAVGTPRKEP